MEFLEHENNEFLIKHHKDWQIKETPSETGIIVNFISPKQTPDDRFQESVIVSVQKIPNVTLENYTSGIVQGLESTKELLKTEIVGEKGSEFLNQKAHSLIYTSDLFGMKVRTGMLWTIKDGKIYHITYIGLDQDYFEILEVVKKMIDSFVAK